MAGQETLESWCYGAEPLAFPVRVRLKSKLLLSKELFPSHVLGNKATKLEELHLYQKFGFFGSTMFGWNVQQKDSLGLYTWFDGI